MVFPLKYGQTLPNPTSGRTFRFRGRNSNPPEGVVPEITKFKLVALTLQEADARINEFDYQGWTGVTDAGTFEPFLVSYYFMYPNTWSGYDPSLNTTDNGRANYVYFETDDDDENTTLGNPINPWRPWWPKSSARNTFYGLDANGNPSDLPQFERYHGYGGPSSTYQYYSPDLRNQVLQIQDEEEQRYVILKIYDAWLKKSHSAASPKGVSLVVPSTVNYDFIDGSGQDQKYVRYQYTDPSKYVRASAVQPYASGNSIVTPICKTDGTSTTSSYFGLGSSTLPTGLHEQFRTAGTTTSGTGDNVPGITAADYPAASVGDFVQAAWQNIDQLVTSAYVGAAAPDASQLGPIYYQSNGVVQRMSNAEMLETFIKPVISLMTGAYTEDLTWASTDEGENWTPYVISSSISAADDWSRSTYPVYVDYYASGFPVAGYPLGAGTISANAGNFTTWTTTLNTYYLYSKRRVKTLLQTNPVYAATTPETFVTIDDSGVTQARTLDYMITNVFLPLLEWALVSYSNYRVRYVIEKREGTGSVITSTATRDNLTYNLKNGLITPSRLVTLGSVMRDQQRDSTYTKQIARSGDDYRSQQQPTGTVGQTKYYFLEQVRY